ncbi:hypothetical protein BGZ96_007279 [Linnemannia gamsii]|uniref:F-box domain-containing protein n=1 Tax=Linnemannia gamsii TaxID=64522 RepID=A0ABQ7KG82_9FUNG|nr:hypothetical protein BGZ96_007279 [Linnemannia gamsii]
MKMRLPFLKRHSRAASKGGPVTLPSFPSKQPPSPLDIPEILEIIFSFVDEYTLFKTVVLVCREWCIMNLGVCKEVVWDGTWESQDLTAALARVPGVGHIRWHSEVGHDQESHWDRLIKALKSNHERYLKRLQQPPAEPSSRRLSMDGRRDEGSWFMRRRPLFDGPLRKLDICGAHYVDGQIHDFLPFAQWLTCLSFRLGQSYEFQMSLLFKACPRLEELRAETEEGAFYLPGQWIPLEASKPLALRVLVLRNTHFSQSSLEELLVVTPRLEELKLINLARGNGCYPEEGQVTSRYHWQGLIQHIRALPLRLRSVHFSVRDEIMTDADLRSMMFDVCPRSTEWTLWASDLKPMVVQSMNELPNHITSLDLYWHDRSGCLSAAGDALHQYLCASPHLMHLRTFNVGFDFKHMDVHNRAGLRYSDFSEVHTITETAMVTSGIPQSRDDTGARSQVWKCRNLRTLYIELHGHGDEMIKDPVQSRIIFGYIAAVCPQLRDLHIKVPWACRSNSEVYYPAICLQLEGGLCHLARLQHLTRLRFQDWTFGTSRYDLNWMTPLGQSVRYRRKRQEVMAQWEPWLQGEAEQGRDMMRMLRADAGLHRSDCTLPAQLYDLGLLRAVKAMVEEIDSEDFRCWPKIQGLSLTGKFERRPQDELQCVFPSKRLSIF